MKTTISDHHQKENLGDNGRVSFNDLPKMSFQNMQGGCFSLKTTVYQNLLFKTLVCLSLEELRRPCLLMTYPKCLSRASKEDASMHDCAVFL